MKYLIAVIFISSFLAIYGLNFATLFDVDEAVFSQATKEMMQRGDIITPSYNGVNRYDKPILFYWIMWITYSIFGINEIGARLSSAIAGIALCIALYLFVSRPVNRLTEKTAFFAAMSFATSIYFLIYSHAAVVDMTLTFCISMSLFSFYLYLYQEKNKMLHILAFYAFSALAFLTKGLIGIIFPFGIAVIFLLFTQGWRFSVKVFDIRGITVFVIIALPWYIAQIYANGWEFIEQFIIKHHFQRYTSVNSGHSGPIYYYLLTLLVGLFPWVVMLPKGILTVIKTRQALGVFSLIWLCVIVIFFSLSSTKLPNYILPSVPAFAIVISMGIEQVLNKNKWTQKYEQILLIFIFVLGAIAFFIAFEYALSHIGAQYWMYICAFIFTLTAIFLLISLMKQSIFLPTLFISSFTYLVVLQSFAVPVISQYLQGTLHSYSIFIKQKSLPNEKITVFNLNYPSINFYSDRFIKRIFTQEEARQIKEGFAISKSTDKQILVDVGFEIIQDDGRFTLFYKTKKD